MRRRVLIQVLLGAVLVSGSALESTHAGLLDNLVEKAKNKAETKARSKANEIIGQTESAVEQKIDAVLGGVSEAKATASGLHSSIGGALETIAARDLAIPAPEGFLEGGAFFQTPAGVSNRAEIQSKLVARRRPPQGNYVELLRRQAQDAYYGFWLSWYATMEQMETSLRILREQRARLTLFGAEREAARTAIQIGDLEEQLRAVAQSPQQRGASPGRAAPLALFGLNARSEAIPKEVLVAGASQIVALLADAASRPNSEAVQQEIYDLARDVTSIRAKLEADELEAAQALMDRRWAWVMGD